MNIKKEQDFLQDELIKIGIDKEWVEKYILPTQFTSTGEVIMQSSSRVLAMIEEEYQKLTNK